MKTIEEGNKLIAEFVGAKLTKGNFYLLDGEILAHEADLKYHTSWDWLMPVVEKIRGQVYESEFTHMFKYGFDSFNKLSIWAECINHIEKSCIHTTTK